MNLKTTSYAPLLIMVAFLASLVDYFLLGKGGFGWLSLGALIVGLLSVFYLIGRAVQNMARDIQTDRQHRLDKQEVERVAREQLQARIIANNAQQVQNARDAAEHRTNAAQ